MNLRDSRNIVFAKLLLAIIVGLFLLGNFIIDKDMFTDLMCNPISKCKVKPPNYFAAKSAGYAIVASVFVIVAVIPAYSGWGGILVNILVGILASLSAFGSGWYWLKDATNDDPSPYIYGLIGLFVVAITAITFWAITTASVIGLDRTIPMIVRQTKSKLKKLNKWSRMKIRRKGKKKD